LFFLVTAVTGALYGLYTGGSTFVLVNFLLALVVAVTLGIWVVRSVHGYGRFGKTCSPLIAVGFWSTGLYTAWTFWLFRSGVTPELVAHDPRAVLDAIRGLIDSPHSEGVAYGAWIAEALGFLVLPALAGWIEFSSRHETNEIPGLEREQSTVPAIAEAKPEDQPAESTEDSSESERVLESVE